MPTSPDLGLPLLASSQATPEVLHNEAIRALGALANGVISVGLNTPPGSPTDGDAYVVGAAGTGAWSGKNNCIAIYMSTAWRFVPGNNSAGTQIAIGVRNKGLVVYNRFDGAIYLWSGAAWGVASRPILLAARTYYVRTDGNNANDGLTNSAGGAFLTVQAAVDAACRLDFNGQNVTIQIGDGTYTGTVNFSAPWIGGGMLTIQGNSGTPANVTISVTSNDCFRVSVALTGILVLKDMKLSTTTSGSCIDLLARAYLTFANLVFGASAASHIVIASSAEGSYVTATGNYEIAGNCTIHISASGHTLVVTANRTVLLTGTPAWGSSFVTASRGAQMSMDNMTFTNTATGTRYSVSRTALIDTNSGASPTYLPGSVNGSATAPGVYA